MKNFIPAHALCFFSGPDAPEPRNLTNELLQTLQGRRATERGFYDLEREYQPLYSQLGLDQSALGMYGYDDPEGNHHPGSLELQRFGTRYQRGGDVADVAEFGPAAQRAYLDANPYLEGGLNEVYSRLGDSDILSRLNTQANEELALNGDLSPEEQREVEQASRRAFSDRGTLFGNQSIGTELLNRNAARRARLAEARQFGGTVEGLNQAQNDWTGRATQIFGTQLSDPIQTILGRSSGAGGGGSGEIGTGARLFNPNDPYAADIYNTNFNAEAANNIAQANAQNANTGLAINAAGSLIGGILSDERVKTDVKTTGKKTAEGVPIKDFKYKTDPKKRTFRGVMAQDQEKVNPKSVLTDPVSGLKAIKYQDTDAPFAEVRGKGKKKKVFNLLSGEFEKAA